MTLPNSGEKRVHFFHEIEVEGTQYEHQKNRLKFERWEDKSPFKAMDALYREHKDDLISRLKSLELECAALQKSIEENKNRTAPAKIARLRSTIGKIEGEIADMGDSLTRKNYTHASLGLKLDDRVPDMYPVSFVVSDSQGNGAPGSVGSHEDHIVGIFTARHGLVYKKKGVITGRETSMDQFFVIPYGKIFKNANDPRFDILNVNGQNVGSTDALFLNQSRVYHNGGTTVFGCVMDNGEIKIMNTVVGYVDNDGFNKL